MTWELLLRYIFSPERIVGIVWDFLPLIAMCFIFHAWNEKWWKCLIPVYGNYISYKHTWRYPFIVLSVKILFDILQSYSIRFIRKHIVGNVLQAIVEFIKTGEIQFTIDMEQILFYLILGLICGFITFIIARCTYAKVCKSLEFNNGWLMVGTFIIPEIFLLVDYVCWRKNKKFF